MQGTGGIHNMRIVNTYSPSYQSQKPDKLLETAEKEKKRKYLEAWLKQHQHFTPLVASVDGLVGVEEEAAFKHIASRLAAKWN